MAQPQESFQERMARRAEERNAEARANLVPIEEGERPPVLVAGAILSAVIAVIFTVSAIVAAIGEVEITGSEPDPLPLAAFGLALWWMAVGMWQGRYWAILGFQMLLVLLLVGTAIGLVVTPTLTVIQVALSLLLLGVLGAMFYFMIKVMARMQIPMGPED